MYYLQNISIYLSQQIRYRINLNQIFSYHILVTEIKDKVMFFEIFQSKLSSGGHNYQTDVDVQPRFSKSGAFVVAKFTKKGLLVRRKILNKKRESFGWQNSKQFFRYVKLSFFSQTFIFFYQIIKNMGSLSDKLIIFNQKLKKTWGLWVTVWPNKILRGLWVRSELKKAILRALHSEHASTGVPPPQKKPVVYF